MRHLELTLAATLLLTGIGLLSVTFSPAFDVPTFGGDVGPAFAPRGYLIVWITLALIILVQAKQANPAPLSDYGNMRRLLAVVGVGVATGFAMLWLGFVIAAIPGLFAFAYALGYRRLGVLITLSIAAPLTIWALFTFGFELLLPRSPWFGRL
ncbi:hypothetical protein GTA62_19035 [Roseobacter sp. HKCCD9010]|uniref:tripartite tricarboxylate transporter TctB family protein n=1 Tax=unclassified Roseobacter TaxID=196798 RepID=UPI0014931A2C|nr:MULTISPECIES: tripartite tricarboxylate transporter TctB family protein [unclassified Roseobacter]MBF9052126.1 hypothetical protein [Rhodobacterales bacterium HKCCD4356]NNV14046.1 hypothetical protein [Roseobacter sp. HKCCD7357]NNV18280.1 hypothetical protein [Roseobacter sp. HKCCD8768]NNV27745.1 hypothetical protein [Roseobacter sp. HKCCD8192]NNV32020.1 hypothetical protein [Roseobacter sp. HKCCD9061]